MSSRRNTVRAALASVAVLATTAIALAGGTTTKLIARMPSFAGMRAKAVYVEVQRNDGGLRQKLSVEVEKAQPGETIDVFVDGAFIATLTADGLGIAEVELDAGDDEPGQTTLPRIGAGDTVQVGALHGTFAPRR